MAIYMWRDYNPPELCFTASTANSTVTLNKVGSPTAVTLETSADGISRTTYTIGTAITLSNGDKVYWRNTSETTTGFSTNGNNYYQFVMTGTIRASGDTNYLINKNSTDTLVGNRCYQQLFKGCSSLTTAARLPATTLTEYCYYQMFYQCTSLNVIPKLPATTLKYMCYGEMFRYGNPTLSTSYLSRQYRIPSEGTGTTASSWNYNMFANTSGGVSEPSINTSYYTNVSSV